MVLAPVAGLPPGQELYMQPSESTVLGAASDEPGIVSGLVLASCTLIAYPSQTGSQLGH